MSEAAEIALLRQLIELTPEPPVNPYSREFIFGGCENYVRLRNEKFAGQPNERMTLLRAMLRFGLDEMRRTNMYSSPYHLGCEKGIPDRDLTIVGLARKVRKDKQEKQDEKDKPLKLPNGTSGIHIRNDPKVLKKDFESITDALKKIIGTTVGKYENKQSTLRVIYLFNRMMPGSGFPEERSARFLTLLNSLTRGFSFEARDAYPIKESENNTHLLNDLKAYLSIEIDNETQDRIDSVFNSLINRADNIRSHLDRVAYSSGQQQRAVQAYRFLANLIETADFLASGGVHIRRSRLDVDLYLHLNRFEFLHYSGAHAEILEVAKPPSPIASIRTEIIEALSAYTGSSRIHYDITVDNFWLDAFPEVATQYSKRFLDLIENALGYRPSDLEYKKRRFSRT